MKLNPEAVAVLERVADFPDFVAFFRELTLALSKRRTVWGMSSWWARRLGYEDSSSIQKVLKGKRQASLQLADKLALWLNLSGEKKRFLDLLVRKALPSTVPDRRVQLERELDDLKKTMPQRTVLSESEVAYLAHWWTLVLKNLVARPGFRPDCAKISRVLGEQVPAQRIQEALERMVRVGLLERAPMPRGYRVAKTQVMSSVDVPLAAIRQHHREQLRRGVSVLAKMPVEEREFSSLTLRFSMDRIGEAKEFIREFVDRFDSRFGSERDSEVCQLNVQFFPQTQMRSEKYV